MADKGFVYCFSNQYIPGLLKIGLTKRTIAERLRDANSETYSPPFWICTLAKAVDNVVIIEGQIHKLLEVFGYRLTPKREFFSITVDKARAIFDLLPGTYYEETTATAGISDQEELEQVQGSQKRDKNLADYLNDGAQLKHNLANSTWYATYNVAKNCIINNDKNEEYPTLSAFARAHFLAEFPDRADEGRKRSGWSECYAFIDEEWRSMRTLAAFG